MSNGELRQFLVDNFNETELRELCFDLEVDHEELAGQTKGEKVMELINFMDRRGRLPELLELCRQRRPHVTWPGAVDKSTGYETEQSGEMLQQSANPFTYGNPISEPNRFFGRQLEVEQVFSRLRNPEAESSSLVGGRRIGKTSLLKYLAHPDVRRQHGLDPDRFIFVYVDLQMLDRSTTPPRLWRRLLSQMARHCRDSSVKYVIKEVQSSDDIDNFALADVFDVVDEQGQHIVLLLDEFENVTENENFGTDFFYGLRSLAIQHNLSLITSSHHELIELTHSEAIRSSPFFNIFANINLRLFTKDEARNLIGSTLASTNVAFDDSEIDSVLRLAGTYPYFLQAACHFLFRAHGKDVGPDERLEYVEKRFRPEAAPHMDHYWRMSDEREQIMLLALALLNYSAQPSKQALGLKDLAKLYSRSEQTIARLVKRALVTKEPSGYALFSTSFGAWIVEAISEKAGDGLSYEAWLESNGRELERLQPVIRKDTLEITRLVDERYRSLITNWASDTDEPEQVVALLKSALT